MVSLGKYTVYAEIQYYLGKVMCNSNRESLLIKLVAASFLAYMSIMVPELSCKLRCLLFFYPSPQKGITFQFPSSFITPGPQLLKNICQFPPTHPHKETQEILKARMRGIRVVYKCVSSLLSPPFSKQILLLASSLKRGENHTTPFKLLDLETGNEVSTRVFTSA